jgi:hypothetical protein
MYGIFGREITKYTVIYGAYIRFWPTLGMCHTLIWRNCLIRRIVFFIVVLPHRIFIAVLRIILLIAILPHRIFHRHFPVLNVSNDRMAHPWLPP